MSRQWNALGVSHRFIKRYLPEGGFAIDATAGNGGDTLMLCETVGHTGRVLALDIQQQAIENTRKLLEEKGFSHQFLRWSGTATRIWTGMQHPKVQIAWCSILAGFPAETIIYSRKRKAVLLQLKKV